MMRKAPQKTRIMKTWMSYSLLCMMLLAAIVATGQTMSVYHASHQGEVAERPYPGKGFGLPNDFMANYSPQYYYMNGQQRLQTLPREVPQLEAPLLHTPPRAVGKYRCRCGQKRYWLGAIVLGAMAAAFLAGRYVRTE